MKSLAMKFLIGMAIPILILIVLAALAQAVITGH
jgi:hypothetical protein